MGLLKVEPGSSLTSPGAPLAGGASFPGVGSQAEREHKLGIPRTAVPIPAKRREHFTTGTRCEWRHSEASLQPGDETLWISLNPAFFTSSVSTWRQIHRCAGASQGSPDLQAPAQGRNRTCLPGFSCWAVWLARRQESHEVPQKPSAGDHQVANGRSGQSLSSRDFP